MAAPLLTVAAAAGTALKVYGTWKEGRDRAELLRQQAELDALRADEVVRRARINKDLLLRRGALHAGLQEVAIAGSGRAQSSTTLRMLSNTMNQAADQAKRYLDVAHWEASMIRAGVDSKRRAANEIKKASALQSIGEAVIGGLSIYESMPGTTPKSPLLDFKDEDYVMP